MKKGFTLIETVVYVALLALMMGGTLLAVYQILSSSSATSTHDQVGMEANFVLRKLAWAMSQADTIVLPSAAHPSGSTLSVVTLSRATVNIKVDNLVAEGSNPQVMFTRIQDKTGVVGIEAALTLGGKSFYFKKYLRK